LGWTIAVLFGDWPALLYVSAYLIFHGAFLISEYREWWLVIGTVVCGVAIDSVLGGLGIIIFSESNIIVPVWLVCLWVLFACTIKHALFWIRNHSVVASVLGGIAGPISYFVGTELSSADLGEPLWRSLAILALIWAVILLILSLLLKKSELGKHGQSCKTI